MEEEKKKSSKEELIQCVDGILSVKSKQFEVLKQYSTIVQDLHNNNAGLPAISLAVSKDDVALIIKFLNKKNRGFFDRCSAKKKFAIIQCIDCLDMLPKDNEDKKRRTAGLLHNLCWGQGKKAREELIGHIVENEYLIPTQFQQALLCDFSDSYENTAYETMLGDELDYMPVVHCRNTQHVCVSDDGLTFAVLTANQKGKSDRGYVYTKNWLSQFCPSCIPGTVEALGLSADGKIAMSAYNKSGTIIIKAYNTKKLNEHIAQFKLDIRDLLVTKGRCFEKKILDFHGLLNPNIGVFPNNQFIVTAHSFIICGKYNDLHVSKDFSAKISTWYVSHDGFVDVVSVYKDKDDRFQKKVTRVDFTTEPLTFSEPIELSERALNVISLDEKDCYDMQQGMILRPIYKSVKFYDTQVSGKNKKFTNKNFETEIEACNCNTRGTLVAVALQNGEIGFINLTSMFALKKELDSDLTSAQKAFLLHCYYHKAKGEPLAFHQYPDYKILPELIKKNITQTKK